MPKRSVFDMPFIKIYSLLTAQAERKGRTKYEVDEIIMWLTGYESIAAVGDVSYREYLSNAPKWNPRS